MRESRFRRRIVLAILAVILVPPLSYLAWDQSTYNFDAIRPGELYRSGQMPAKALTETLREHGIKTVLNLRGENPDQPWYRAERTTALSERATLVDVPMSSSEWITGVRE